jgi:hypothetical protein
MNLQCYIGSSVLLVCRLHGHSATMSSSGSHGYIVKSRVDTLSSDSDDEKATMSSGKPPQTSVQHVISKVLKTAEVFSGSGKHSKSLARRGVDTFEIDIKHSADFDMSDAAKVTTLTNTLMIHDRRQYVHFAPPCNTYSSARHPRIRPSDIHLWNPMGSYGFPWIPIVLYPVLNPKHTDQNRTVMRGHTGILMGFHRAWNLVVYLREFCLWQTVLLRTQSVQLTS